MHLRLGNTIPLGSRVPSRVLRHSSSALLKAHLETVNEENKSLSKSDSAETNSMSSNLVQPEDRRMDEPMAGVELLGNPTI